MGEMDRVSDSVGDHAEFSRSLTRTIRALGLIGKPMSARSLAGSFPLGPTIAALRWLLDGGYVDSGTSHTAGRHREPVYWLTSEGLNLYRNLLCRSNTADGPT
ncbi:hypothetical protein K7711_45585 [Nocardia sp. CA2R105]|uniref:hypothetical protein n=1 Tax=Nocardia coffeae TaxID=2873381 RepID=UPI001CA79C60|nr:hypothetical protein [Nocardia coffeae]MBY8863804.1 hypothetical protein [Nocardia coffeae]